MELKDQPCDVFQTSTPSLDAQQIQTLMPELPQWKIVEVVGVKQLTRCFVFNNFAEALAFSNKVGELAEVAGHHPDLLTQWGKVTVNWWTHSINGLQKSDFIMATRCDGIS